MGKKSTPAAPQAPDPAATAAAQATANNTSADFNAKLNRINTTTPYGSQTYTHTPGADANDPGTWSQQVTLSPEQQKLYNTQTGVTQQSYDLAAAQFPRVNSVLGSGFNFNGPSMAGPISANGGPIQSNIGDAGQGITGDYASGGGVQHGLDYSGAPSLVSGDALAKFGGDVSGSIYNQATRNLDPRFQAEEQKTGDNLVNRGIAVGSPAFNRAMESYRQSRDNAYADAQDRATQGGVSAANTLFGQGLAARQQSVGETTTQGQFANSAQQLAEAEAASRAGFGNAAQAQTYSQNADAAKFANTAQQQGWAQQLALAQQNAALQNQAHATGYNEQLQARELPLQEIGGLLGTGPGVQQQQFGATPIVSTQAPNYEGDVNANYANQLSVYNAAQQRQGAGMGGLFSALGTLGGAAIGAPWMGGLLGMGQSAAAK